jgi:acylphosphatase
MTGRRFVITGRVQGVGFRRFVEVTAYDLNVIGEVWNREDGSVECEAWGEDLNALLVFERRLLTGPGHPTQVSTVDLQKDSPPHSAMVAVNR